jgi:excinuclease UvrABC ATPase subunit
VMNEPTTGLHMSVIGHLLGIMNRLVDARNTVIVIEHNLDVISQADWIINMGSEAARAAGTYIEPNDLN